LALPQLGQNFSVNRPLPQLGQGIASLSIALYSARCVDKNTIEYYQLQTI